MTEFDNFLLKTNKIGANNLKELFEKEVKMVEAREKQLFFNHIKAYLIINI
ncbi:MULTISPECIES: hypothetical protein [unclassified Campylobacter]|uniref:hypothetical protein n=1 Tax=unclassified Campylobacter TaxID=2593542 RepID=UPI0016811C91|nr:MULTISPECIES: hypothetical protein [unclassified Campylobacter]